MKFPIQESLRVSNYWIVKEINAWSGISATIRHSRASFGEGRGRFSAPLKPHPASFLPSPLCITPHSFQSSVREASGQRKRGFQKVGRRVTVLIPTPEMSKNGMEWLSLTKRLSGTSPYPAHSGKQDSLGPCFHGLTKLQGFSYSNAYLCDNGHHPQRSGLLWTQNYVKNQVYKRLSHPHSWVQFGEDCSSPTPCRVGLSWKNLPLG